MSKPRRARTVGGMHVSGLFIYPVKSLRGCAVTTVTVDALGFVGDRRFLVIDADGRFLTQRAAARMATVGTALRDDALVLSADGAPDHAVALRPAEHGPSRTVSVWRSHDLAVEDCGDGVAAWLTTQLRMACRLVRMSSSFRRPVLQKPRYAAGVKPAQPDLIEGRIVTSDLVNFADGYPVLAISEASLADLNDRLAERGEEAVPMDRFRPSIVVAGCARYAEDAWQRVVIGGVQFRSGGPCGRCIVTTTDQLTGERGVEPLRTLARYRRDATDPSDVNFGVNLIHETKTGLLRIGDPVVVHEPASVALPAGSA